MHPCSHGWLEDRCDLLVEYVLEIPALLMKCHARDVRWSELSEADRGCLCDCVRSGICSGDGPPRGVPYTEAICCWMSSSCSRSTTSSGVSGRESGCNWAIIDSIACPASVDLRRIVSQSVLPHHSQIALPLASLSLFRLLVDRLGLLLRPCKSPTTPAELFALASNLLSPLPSISSSPDRIQCIRPVT